MMTRLTTYSLAPLLFVAAIAATPAAAQSRHDPLGLEIHRLVSRMARVEVYGQSQGPERTETWSKTFRVGPTAVLDLSNMSGDVTVKGASTDTITIDAVKRTRRNNADEAKRELASVTIEAAERSGRVEVQTVYPPRRDTRVSIDFTIAVPSGGSVFLKSMSGDLRVTNVKGEVRAETMSGNVRGDALGRIVRLKSMSGDVEASALDPQAEVSATSVSGTVIVQKVSARTLELNSISGDVRLGDVTCDRVTAGSMSGDVEYTGTLSKNGRYELKSHSGNIRLTIGSGVGFEVEATTFSGNVSSALPVTYHTTEGERRSHRHQAMHGVFGEGGALLLLHTFSGNIVINKR